MLNVVHVAIGGGAAAARPGAVLVAEQDRPADIPSHTLITSPGKAAKIDLASDLSNHLLQV